MLDRQASGFGEVPVDEGDGGDAQDGKADHDPAQADGVVPGGERLDEGVVGEPVDAGGDGGGATADGGGKDFALDEPAGAADADSEADEEAESDHHDDDLGDLGEPGDAEGGEQDALLAAGYRVITYDRRGFGNSSKPSSGYDFDTLSADLAALLDYLDLTGVSLVGYSMGTGEAVRYLATRGEGRINRVALLAPLPPFLLRTPDNPAGLYRRVFEQLIDEISADRPAAAKNYLDRCYNIDLLGGSYVSDQAWQNSFQVAIRSSATAARECVRAWMEDFRADIACITIPALVVQGDQDRVFPPEVSGNRLACLLSEVRHLVIRDGPHAIIWTDASTVNSALLEFLRPGRSDVPAY